MTLCPIAAPPARRARSTRVAAHDGYIVCLECRTWTRGELLVDALRFASEHRDACGESAQLTLPGTTEANA